MSHLFREIIPNSEYQKTIEALRYNKIPFTASRHGMTSVSVQSWRQKIVNAACTGDFEGRQMLPGEAARVCIADNSPKRIMVYPHTAPIPAPLFYNGDFIGECFYIDIKSAYANIYKNLWLDSVFTGTRLYPGTIELRPIYERVKNFKQARNAIPGILNSDHFALHVGLERKIIKSISKYYNPNIWNFCNYTCQRLANAATQGGIIYWNTDGGFLFNPDPVLKLADKLRLPYVLDYGELELFSFARYKWTGHNLVRDRMGRIAPRVNHHINNIARFKE